MKNCKDTFKTMEYKKKIYILIFKTDNKIFTEKNYYA